MIQNTMYSHRSDSWFLQSWIVCLRLPTINVKLLACYLNVTSSGLLRKCLDWICTLRILFNWCYLIFGSWALDAPKYSFWILKARSGRLTNHENKIPADFQEFPVNISSSYFNTIYTVDAIFLATSWCHRNVTGKNRINIAYQSQQTS